MNSNNNEYIEHANKRQIYNTLEKVTNDLSDLKKLLEQISADKFLEKFNDPFDKLLDLKREVNPSKWQPIKTEEVMKLFQAGGESYLARDFAEALGIKESNNVSLI